MHPEARRFWGQRHQLVIRDEVLIRNVESTLETITKQPTSQLNETDVTLNLFSPTTPEPTIIPETPTIYETPMDYPPASPSAQALSGHSSLERKTRKDSLTYRRRHYVHSRLEDKTGVTPRPTIFEESDDEKDEEPTVVCSLSRSGLEKKRIRSRDRRCLLYTSPSPRD